MCRTLPRSHLDPQGLVRPTPASPLRLRIAYMASYCTYSPFIGITHCAAGVVHKIAQPATGRHQTRRRSWPPIGTPACCSIQLTNWRIQVSWEGPREGPGRGCRIHSLKCARPQLYFNRRFLLNPSSQLLLSRQPYITSHSASSRCCPHREPSAALKGLNSYM